MATNYKLTPIYRNGLLQRWRKKDKRLTLAGLSNPWYFPASKTETKEQSYRRAWAAWKEVEKQLVAATLPPIYSVRANVNFAYEPPKPIEGIPRSEGPPLNVDGRKFVLLHCSDGEQRYFYFPEGSGSVVQECRSVDLGQGSNPQAITDHAIARLNSTATEDGASTIGKELADQYQKKLKKAKAGQASTKTADRFQQKVQHFVKWLGVAFPTASINDATLVDYHLLLCEELKAGKRKSAGGCKDQLAAIKHFLRTAHVVSGTLPILPKLLTTRNHTLTFKSSHNSRQAKRRDTANWHDRLDKLAEVYGCATNRTKLLMLLMLNCGYQQTDISELAQTEVDWKEGTITRKRSKGEKCDNVPVVTYHLWSETLALLKQFAASENAPLNRNKEARLLLNNAGKPLLNEETDADNIADSYYRALKKADMLGENYKPPASLRKTSSTLLDHSVRLSNHQWNYKPVAKLYLGQAPSDVQGRHYTPEDHAMLVDALGWLRQQYKSAKVF